jgi:GTPase SAR1 family protein
LHKFCGKDIPKFLLGNKVDLSAKREIQEDAGIKMAKELNVDYLETSAKSGTNVNQAFNTIVQLILQNK